MMKTVLHKSLASLICVCLCLSLNPAAFAGSTTYADLSVGSTKTLYAHSSRGTVTSYGWYSNNIDAVQIVGSNTSQSCTIKAVGYTSSDVVVRCDMYYRDNRGMIGSDYYDCIVRVSNNGSGGSYTITASSTNVTIDRANVTPVTITSGVNFSDAVYLRFSNTQGSAGWNFEYYNNNKADLYIFPQQNGSGACKVELIQKSGSTTFIKSSVTIRYTATCYHNYDSGKITVQPTSTSEGTKVYTCLTCGTTKSERIPKLKEPSTYTVSYNANGGENAPASQTKAQGTALTLSSDRPTHADSLASSYTVTLNANGGSVSPASLTAARTTSYSFTRWNTKADGSGTSYSPGAVYNADESSTLFAQWSSSTSTASVSLPTPTWSGHTFKGWATDRDADTGITGSYTPSRDMTLFAAWKKDPSSAQGNIVIDNVSASRGAEISVPIRLDNNPGIISIQFELLYDSRVLEWIGVEPGIYGNTLGTYELEAGQALTWFGDDERTNINDNGVFATLIFRINENAEASNSEISVKYLEDDLFNADFENVPFAIKPGQVMIQSHTPGDVNGDGMVNNKDYMALRRYIKYADNKVVEEALDINNDGKVNNKDYMTLRRYIKYKDIEIH